MHRRLILHLVVGIIIGALFLWLLFRQISWADFSTVLKMFPIDVLIYGAIVFFVGAMFRVARWFFLVREFDPNVQFKLAFWSFVAGTSLNNLLPMRAGDVYRVFGFRKKWDATATQLITAMFLERILDLLVLFCLLLFLATFFPWNQISLNEELLSSIKIVVWLSVAALLLMIVFFPILIVFGGKLEKSDFIRRLGWSEQISRVHAEFNAAATMLHQKRLFMKLCVLTASTWLIEGAVFWIVASSTDQLSSDIAAWLVMGLSTLATLLPSTPGFFGAFDYIAANGFELFGLSILFASASALTVHFILWLPITLVGILYLLLPGTVKFQWKNARDLIK